VRVINFNINGAKVPGKKDHDTQGRSWHLLAAYGADLALLQEVEHKAIPGWARERWTIITGDRKLVGAESWGWGSAIAARPHLKLRPRNDLLDDRHVRLTYDYAVFGEIDLPRGASALVVSVHAPARELPQYLEILEQPDALSKAELDAMAHAGDEPYVADLFFAALVPVLRGKRFIRRWRLEQLPLFDLVKNMRESGEPPWSTMFFTRAHDAGWFECHGDKNEERSYFRGERPHQLDHAFCDKKTAEHMVDCSVRADWIARELSDTRRW